MKLAEALTLRSDIQRRISELSYRLQRNALVQEGEQPAEDPLQLISQLNDNYQQLTDLICRINLTNAQTVVDGLSLTARLAQRDCENQRLEELRNFVSSASATVTRATHTEIKIKRAVDVKALQQTIDEAAKQLRQLEVTIQQLNWTTELL
jgi:polyhydroxyalkanoate synthesis regulator phasin